MMVAVFLFCALFLESYSLAEKEVEISGRGIVGPYQLPHFFIVEGSEEIWVDSIKLRTEEYEINYDFGYVLFQEELNTTAKLRYKIFPFNISREYYHKRIIGTALEKSVEEKNSVDIYSPPDDAQLFVNGCKTFSVSFGSKQDMALNQSLHVNLAGEVSGVEVTGVLSDESGPLGVEGTTEELSELDDVYIEIKSKSLGCKLGDYDLSIKNGEFGSVNRKLEGATGNANLPYGEFVLAGAVTKGRFATNRFNGEDNRQGPYELKTEEGEGCAIVAGSEKVWFDGELLKRGEINDYTIDYSMGSITFTAKKPITSESKIVVDFQYSDEDFKRNLYAGLCKTFLLDKKLSFGATILTESDDSGNPLRTSFSDERKRYLSNIGDDTLSAWVDGGEFVGEGNGDYRRVDDYYEYAGKNGGDYRVAFTYIGEGKGDYAYDNSVNNYLYRGEGNGSYVAKVKLPLPHSYSFYDFHLQSHPVEPLKINLEYAISDEDLNTFSKIDDGDNKSFGYTSGFDFKDFHIPYFGKLSLSGYHKNVDKNFTPPGRKSSVNFEDKWNTKEKTSAQNITEIYGGYNPLSFIGINGGYGILRYENSQSETKTVATKISPHRFPYLSLWYENVLGKEGGNSNFRTRKGGSIGYKIYKFEPSVSYKTEDRDSTQYDEYGGNTSFNRDGIFLKTGMRYRKDKTLQDIWSPLSKEIGGNFHGDLRFSSTSALVVNYTYRKKIFEEGQPGENFDYSLASFKFNSTPFKDVFCFDAFYTVNNKEEKLTKEIFKPTQEGRGDYKKNPETGEYYRDEEGDYIKEIVLVGDPVSTVDLNTSFSSNFSVLPILELETFASAEENTKEKDKKSIYLLNFTKFQKDLTTIEGEISLENILTLFPKNKVLSVRIRQRDEKIEDNRSEGRHEAKMEKLRSVRFESKKLKKITLILEGELCEDEKSSTENGLERLERERNLRFEVIHTRANIDISSEQGGTISKIRQPFYYPQIGEIELKSLFVSPEVVYKIKGKGRFKSSIKVTKRSSNVEFIPYDVSLTAPVGITYEWRIGGDYMLNNYLVFLLNYSGEKREGKAIEHRFAIELRGYF